MHMVNLALGKAYETWRHNATVATQNLAAAAGFRNRNLLIGFNTWVEANEETHSKLATLSKLMNWRGAKALRQWLEACDEASEHKRLLTHAVAGLINAQLLKGFNSWAQIVAELRNSYRVMRAALEYRLVAALNTWLDAAAERGTKRGLASNFFERSRGKALRTWVEYIDELQAKRALAVQFRDQSKGKALRTWIEFVEELHAKRKAARCFRAQGRGRAFRSWCELVEEAGIKSKAAHVFRNTARSKGFRTWEEYAAVSRGALDALHRAVGIFRNRAVNAAYNSWYDYSADCSAARDALRNALGALLNRKAMMAINTWYEYALASGEAHDQIRRALGAFSNRKISQAVNTWYEYGRARKAGRSALRRALGAFGNRTLFKAINAWYGATESIQKRKQEALDHAAQAAEVSAAVDAAAKSHAQSAAEAAMAAAEAAMQKAMANGFHRGSSGHASPLPIRHASPARAPSPATAPHRGGADPNQVVVLSTRPRTVMERGVDSMADSKPAFSGSTRGAVPWGAPPRAPNSYRRRAWEHESRTERAVAALDSGRLPSLSGVRGGRHTAERAERSTWGSKMSESALNYLAEGGGGSHGNHCSGSGRGRGSSCDDSVLLQSVGAAGGYVGTGFSSQRGSRPTTRSLSFDSRGPNRRARSRVAHGSQPLPNAAIEAAAGFEYTGEFDAPTAEGMPSRPIVIKAYRPQFAGPGGSEQAQQQPQQQFAHTPAASVHSAAARSAAARSDAMVEHGGRTPQLGTVELPGRAVQFGSGVGTVELPGGGTVDFRESPDGQIEYSLSIRSPTPTPGGGSNTIAPWQS